MSCSFQTWRYCWCVISLGCKDRGKLGILGYFYFFYGSNTIEWESFSTALPQIYPCLRILITNQHLRHPQKPRICTAQGNPDLTILYNKLTDNFKSRSLTLKNYYPCLSKLGLFGSHVGNNFLLETKP